MAHGIKQVFEIVGENQQVPDAAPPNQGFRFGRMFPYLPRFRPTSVALDKLGERMTAVPAPSPDDGEIPAGYTYFGQFIDHDITRDKAGGPPPPSEDVIEVDPVQERSPSLDLDSLYGSATTATLFVEPGDPTRMRLGSTTPFTIDLNPADPLHPNDPVRGAFLNDLPRVEAGDKKGEAVIGDDRNDENLIVAQLHVAFLKFHNKTASVLAAKAEAEDGEPLSPDQLFWNTRKLVTKHYQWLVLNDFVRRLTDPIVYDEVLKFHDLGEAGHRHFRPKPKVFKPSAYETPPMPLEFSVAAYRLGHSMIRNGYAWNRFFPGLPDRPGASLGQLFQFTSKSGFIGQAVPTLPSNWIVDWRHLFDFSADITDGNPSGIKPTVVKKLDTHLASSLGNLPKGGGNLASRNLNRGRHLGIPSAQAIADQLIAMGVLSPDQVLTPEQIVDGIDDKTVLDEETRKLLCEHEFVLETPLWFYILREAALLHGGLRLGPIGSRILIETFLGLIRCSRVSIFDGSCKHPGCLQVFSPELDSPLQTPKGDPITTMAHLLAFVDEINPLTDFTPTPLPPPAPRPAAPTPPPGPPTLPVEPPVDG